MRGRLARSSGRSCLTAHAHTLQHSYSPPPSPRQTPGPRQCEHSPPDHGLLWGPLAGRALGCEAEMVPAERQHPGPS